MLNTGGDGLRLWREMVEVLGELGDAPVEWNLEFLDKHYAEQPDLKDFLDP